MLYSVCGQMPCISWHICLHWLLFYLFIYLVCVINRHLQQQCSSVQCFVGLTEAYHSRVAMLTLASKLKKDDGGKTGRAPGASDSTHRVSIRDRLLTKGKSLCPFWSLCPFCIALVKITLFFFIRGGKKLEPMPARLQQFPSGVVSWQSAVIKAFVKNYISRNFLLWVGLGLV